MHNCWQVPEVTRMIFQQIHPNGVPTSGSITLSCLARTCRTFSNPALDLLWETH
ncbi:hypothetical protein C8R43DRAFT_993500 [Mycena crocata]|nr:hypothetical protein C8R43DRAFT_993500 [Mycena crocata]